MKLWVGFSGMRAKGWVRLLEESEAIVIKRKKKTHSLE